MSEIEIILEQETPAEKSRVNCFEALIVGRRQFIHSSNKKLSLSTKSCNITFGVAMMPVPYQPEPDSLGFEHARIFLSVINLNEIFSIHGR